MTDIVAIHQPNFFPWLGYFDKIARSDVFVFLDHVQYQKTGATWSNRVMLRMGGEARWATAPINRSFHGVVQVNQIEWAAGQPWREKLIKSLEANYAKCRFFRETMNAVVPLIGNQEQNLARYNINAICGIADYIGLDVSHSVLSSSLGVAGQANEMLVALTRAVHGNAYMCGGGAGGYQDPSVFESSGVALVRQGFQHPVYPQAGGGEFLPGLSIVDALMNVGSAGVASFLGVE